MSISAQQVKELRERTGAGLMECKKALGETSGDMDKAIKYLKEKGILKAAEKSGRATKEGIVCVAISDDMSKGSIIEMNCETDFVARTDDFINTSQDIAKKLLDSGAKSVDAVPEEVQTQLKSLIAKLGENMTINQVGLLEGSDNNFITSYIHQGGKIGVLLNMQTGRQETHKNDDFANLAKDICMHIAAMNPQGLNKDSIDPKVIEEQKGIFLTQAKESGKPEKVIEKIVEGKMGQFFKEIVLMDQGFVKEPKMSISKLIEGESKKIGDSDITVKDFIRFKVGE